MALPFNFDPLEAAKYFKYWMKRRESGTKTIDWHKKALKDCLNTYFLQYILKCICDVYPLKSTKYLCWRKKWIGLYHQRIKNIKANTYLRLRMSLITMETSKVFISKECCYPEFLRIHVCSNKMISRRALNHGLQLTPYSVSLVWE